MSFPLQQVRPLDILSQQVVKLKPSKGIIAIPPSTSIAEALSVLAQNNLLALGVYSHVQPSKIVYVVNITDVLNYIVAKFGSKEGVSLDKVGQKELTASIESTMTLDAEVESYRIWEVDYEDTLAEAKTLQQFTHGVHRCIVTDFKNEKTPIIMSQSDIIRYIDQHADTVKPDSVDMNASISSLNLIHTQLVSITTKETAMQGYTRMSQKKVLALPILDEAGQLVANLSASDLRGLTPESLKFLLLPVREFLQTMRSKTQVTPQPNDPPITCTPASSLKQVISLMVSHHVHRIWVTENSVLKGVVSLSDIIKKVGGV